MGQPIVLYKADGAVLVVYGRAQAAVLMSAGWYETEQEAQAAKGKRSSATPDAGAGVVEKGVTVDPAPAAEAETVPTKRKATANREKGGT